MRRGNRSGPRRLVAVAAAGALVVLAACDPAGDGAGGDPAGRTAGQEGARDGQQGDGDAPAAVAASLKELADADVVRGKGAAARALSTSGAMFDSAPVVVLAAEDQQLRAASAGAALGVPVLVDGDGAAEELDRLGAEVALVLGAVQDPGIDVVVPSDDAHLAQLLGVDGGPVPVEDEEAVARLAALEPATPELLVPAEDDGAGSDGAGSDGAGGDSAAATTQAPATAPLTSDRDDLPATTRPEPAQAVTVLTTGHEDDLAALGTARAAGAQVLLARDGDPRSTSETVQALAGQPPEAVLGLGGRFGDAETLAWRARTAATGVELPGGGQLVLPGKTYVALYGTPSTGALGVLGEQPPEETVTRAEELAAAYEPLTDEPVVPTLEIIVTIASAGPGGDGNYSEELAVDEVRPLVDLAAEHGLYVVLDLQPGRTDFLTQAQRYEELLREPHVGLALDPEWRLQPHEVHLTQIGQVGVEEVNEVVTWLADLTREHELPQKVLVLHQFQDRMIPGANDVDRSRSEVAVLIHADGQGAQPDKQHTWRALHQHAPDVEHWGWKNFYDEDVPGPLSPEETMTLVDPVPDFISYQ